MKVFLLLLKYIHDPEIATHLQRIFSLLRGLAQSGSKEQQQGLMVYLESIIRYIFSSTDRVSVEKLKKIIEINIAKDKEELTMTIAEQLIQQGLEQGMQQGVQQGLQQGRGYSRGCKGLL